MRPSQYLIVAFFLYLALAVGAGAEESSQSPKIVEVNVYYRINDSIMAPSVSDDPSDVDADVTKSVFLSVIRYVDPQTGLPYDKTDPTIGFDINDLSHSFRLEKKSFLLGEPILVEHHIELNGPGELDWFLGGNYRSRGRDDNFSFVLRGADGVVVPDVYPRITGIVFGGGLGSNHTIKKGQPLSYWLGLQRYSAITKPGVYDLYCMTGSKQTTFGRVEALRAALPEEVANDHYIDDYGNLVDKQTGQESKRYSLRRNEHLLDSSAEWPVKKLIPDEVYQYARDQGIGLSFAEPGMFGTIAHFKITVLEGTRPQQEEMILQWSKTAGSNPKTSMMGSYKSALFESIWYSRQDSFLPLLEGWIVKNAGSDEPFASIPLYLDALAMRPDPDAFRILLKASAKQITNAFYSLHQNRIVDAIPLCINWLTHPDNQVRAMAEGELVRWTGQSFEHTWPGYHYQRPTPAEGQRMQRWWRTWWEENRKSFKPQEPCDFPCKASEKSLR